MMTALVVAVAVLYVALVIIALTLHVMLHSFETLIEKLSDRSERRD